MTPCEQYTRTLASGEAPSAETRAHVASCAECSALAGFDATLATGVRGEGTTTMALPAALRAALERDHAPVRAPSMAQRALAPVALPAFVALAILVVRPRGDLAVVDVPTFLLLTAVFAALAVGGLAMVFARGTVGLGLPARWRWAFAAASALAFETLAWTLHGGGPLDPADVLPHPWWSHPSCAVFGSLVALAVGALTFRAAKGTAAVSPMSAGGAAGVAAGMAGALTLQFSCGVTEPRHLVTMHVVPIVLGLVLGAWLGPRRLAPSLEG